MEQDPSSDESSVSSTLRSASLTAFSETSAVQDPSNHRREGTDPVKVRKTRTKCMAASTLGKLGDRSLRMEKTGSRRSQPAQSHVKGVGVPEARVTVQKRSRKLFQEECDQDWNKKISDLRQRVVKLSRQYHDRLRENEWIEQQLVEIRAENETLGSQLLESSASFVVGSASLPVAHPIKTSVSVFSSPVLQNMPTLDQDTVTNNGNPYLEK